MTYVRGGKTRHQREMGVEGRGGGSPVTCPPEEAVVAAVGCAPMADATGSCTLDSPTCKKERVARGGGVRGVDGRGSERG